MNEYYFVVMNIYCTICFDSQLLKRDGTQADEHPSEIYPRLWN